MTDHPHLAEFRELALTAVPELTGVPFYVIRQPPELPAPRETSAYCIRGRDLALRDHLKAAGLWQGCFGPTIVFTAPPDDRLAFLALGVHELAHCLPPLVLDDVDPSPREHERQRREVLAWAAADPTRAAGEPWAGHGLRWLRRICHCWFRSLLAGVPLRLVDLQAAGPAYGLSPLFRYIECIGSEPFVMRRREFREVESVPPPAAFSALFESDISAWKAKQKTCDLCDPKKF